MNNKTIKKIRKELNSKEKEMVETVLDYFNSCSFFHRVRIALKIVRGRI